MSFLLKCEKIFFNIGECKNEREKEKKESGCD